MLDTAVGAGPLWARPDSATKRGAWLRAALGPCLAAVLLVGLGEVAARALLTSPSRQIADPEIGFRYMPDSVFFDAKEGGVRLRLNSLGFNDDEVGPKGARRRAVVVGDSMTEAVQVDRASNYVSRLGRLLPDVEFVNAARSDAGPLEYRAILRRVEALLDPDFVLFAFSFGDLEDIRRGSFTVERDAEGGIKDLRLKAASRSEMKRRIEPIIQRSALATLLMRRFGPVLERWRGAAAPDAVAASTPLDDAGCAEILAFILREQATRRRVAALFLPQFDYLADRQSRTAAASAQEAAVVEQAAERAGVPFLLLRDGFAEQYRASGQPGHGFHNNRVGAGHLNPAGHGAAARDVADFLRPALPRRDD